MKTSSLDQEHKGSFLRDDSMSWVSSNLFFMCLNKLNINDEVYYLPKGFEASNEMLTYYVGHLCDELMGLDTESIAEKEAHEYCRKIAAILKSWAVAGHSLKVV